MWACPHWKGTVYSANSTRKDWLGEYSALFSTVEVNSTFYAIPAIETVRRWAESVQPGFAFCLKFPKSITHDKGLRDTDIETMAFLHLLDELEKHGCRGPAFLQLPPQFSGRDWPALEAYLRSLPGAFSYAVEARHGDWFLRGPVEQRLDGLLTELGMDRCLFDSRALFSAPPSDAAEEESQRRKPRSPFRRTVTAREPMVRLVGRNDMVATRPWIEEWAAIVSGWIGEGLRPIVFTHAPDDRFAPDLAIAFHERLRELRPELPPFGAGAKPEPRAAPAAARKPVQRTLF